jgi:hypothetical protein
MFTEAEKCDKMLRNLTFVQHAYQHDIHSLYASFVSFNRVIWLPFATLSSIFSN